MPTAAPPSSSRRLLRRLLLAGAWSASLVTAVVGWGFVTSKWVPIKRRLGMLESTGVLQTNLYDVGFERVPVPIDGRYGAIAPLADGVLFAARSGALSFVDSGRTVRPLATRVPIDIAAFEADPFNATTIERDHFAVKGLLVMPTPAGVRVLASHNQWDAEHDCYFLRVSMTEGPLAALLGPEPLPWTTLWDSHPCVALSAAGPGRQYPSIGAGGRLAAPSPHEVVVTVGAFLSDSRQLAEPGFIRGDSSDYGRTHLIDLERGTSRVLTRGHRNPQGLTIDTLGRLWLTEHGARGGDELDLLRDGADYGYPLVSYGTEYGSLDWRLSGRPGRHDGFEPAAFAWVPSIAPSQLVMVRGARFARWDGDLLVSSLAARALFRVRLDGDRVRYVEPIPTIHRMRDLIQTAAGEIVFLAEDGFLVYLEPVRPAPGR